MPLVSDSVLESLWWQRGQDSRWSQLDKPTTQRLQEKAFLGEGTAVCDRTVAAVDSRGSES